MMVGRWEDAGRRKATPEVVWRQTTRAASLPFRRSSPSFSGQSYAGRRAASQSSALSSLLRFLLVSLTLEQGDG